MTLHAVHPAHNDHLTAKQRSLLADPAYKPHKARAVTVRTNFTHFAKKSSDVDVNAASVLHAAVRPSDGRSCIVRELSRAPLNITAQESTHATAVSACLTKFGGGGVSAARPAALDIQVHEGACLSVSGTGSKRKLRPVRRAEQGWTRHAISARVGPRALLSLVPDPLVTNPRARLHSRLNVDLVDESSLMVVEWWAAGGLEDSGRSSEADWMCDALDTELCVNTEHGESFTHTIKHDYGESQLASMARGRRCFATVVLAGEQVRDTVNRLLAQFGGEHEDGAAFSVSVQPAGIRVDKHDVNNQGCVLRLSANSSELAAAFLSTEVGDLDGRLADNPFAGVAGQVTRLL